MTKEQLERLLAEEKKLYLGTRKNEAAAMRRTAHKRYVIWKYLYCFRMCRYYRSLRENGAADPLKRRLAKYAFRYYNKKRNRYGERAGVEIGLNSELGACPDIWHGGVIVNGTLGERCVLHGNNVIGNKGKNGGGGTPVVGSGVDIGAGAILIGDVRIADGCVIGAGAVVTRSFETPGAVLAGVPARPLYGRTEHEQGGQDG